jgi:hypothetical protein
MGKQKALLLSRVRQSLASPSTLSFDWATEKTSLADFMNRQPCLYCKANVHCSNAHHLAAVCVDADIDEAYALATESAEDVANRNKAKSDKLRQDKLRRQADVRTAQSTTQQSHEAEMTLAGHMKSCLARTDAWIDEVSVRLT